MGAELLEVATPPNPSHALSPGVSNPRASVPAAQVEGSRHPTHTGASTDRGVLLRLRTSQTCVRKVVREREPLEKDHPAWPRWSTEDQDPAATLRARPQPTRTALAHGHAGRTCRRPAASPQSPVAAPTPAPSPPPPAVCTRLPRTPASSTSAKSNGHFTAAPRLRVPGATSAKACAPG